jgi:hypothetical protein
MVVHEGWPGILFWGDCSQWHPHFQGSALASELVGTSSSVTTVEVSSDMRHKSCLNSYSKASSS